MEPTKKRILFTLPNFKTAGSKYVLLAIYNGLDRTYFQPYILVEKFFEQIPDVIPKDEQLLLSRQTSRSTYIKRFRKLLKKQKIDLVHSWDYRSSSLEAIACRLSGVKYLFTKKNNAWSKRWFAKSLLSSHIVYNNPEMLHRFFDTSFLRTKVSLIPHGVDVDFFKPAKSIKDNTYFTMGFIGVIGPNKNQMFLLKALKELPEHFRVWFYGQADEDYLKLLQNFIEDHQLVDRVAFHGFIQNEEIPLVMKQFDVLVLSSKNEGLPLCIIEALACGVPVLSSDAGGGAKFLLQNGGGYLFDLESPLQLVSQLKRIAENPEEQRKLSEEGRKAVVSKFTLQQEIASYEYLYTQLTSKA
ncbi:MAG: glycosyltransferase family 4 protein [Flavobacteriaceae bacterium]|nr:glycosyltransferase family 4 protein [Flavobacteriaceae bacterium]